MVSREVFDLERRQRHNRDGAGVWARLISAAG